MKYIRQWVAGDACDLAEALNNRNVQDNLRDGLPLPYTEKDAMDYINSVLSAPELRSMHGQSMQVGRQLVALVSFETKMSIV